MRLTSLPHRGGPWMDLLLRRALGSDLGVVFCPTGALEATQYYRGGPHACPPCLIDMAVEWDWRRIVVEEESIRNIFEWINCISPFGVAAPRAESFASTLSDSDSWIIEGLFGCDQHFEIFVASNLIAV
ncbi:hypothetical protein Efla_002281 [Eimeria flavescens]